MNQGIRARGSGQLRWQAAGQFGIKDDQARQQRGMKDDLFAAVLDDNRTPARFAAGAGGGGNRDTGSEAAPIRVKVKGDQRLVRSFDAETDDLAHVERAAAAKSNHGIAFALAVGSGGGLHILDDRIGMNTREHRPFFLGDFFQRLEGIGCHQSRIGDNQRLARAQRGQVPGQFLQSADAEPDPGGKRKI